MAITLNLSWYVYNMLVTTIGASLGWFWRNSESCRQEPDFWQERLGRCREDPGPLLLGTPRLWFHAASVGEITGAMATIRLLRDRLPKAVIRLTVGTPTGYRFAREKLADVAEIRPFPLDFPWLIRDAVRSFRPDLYVALEGEFWPNLYRWLHRHNISSVLLNGRISERSARNYRRAEGLFRPIFEHYQWLAMHSEDDRQRAIALGASPERTLVLGSAKYDTLLVRTTNSPAESWRAVLGLHTDTAVIVGGSLRRSERLELLEVYRDLLREHPNLVGIFAPRHLDQLSTMTEWLQARGLPFQFSSRVLSGHERRTASIILVDQMGLLFDLYALGDLIFCGGTLEPLGGHNILEPAAWGKVVFYGPHVGRVLAEHHSLQDSGAGIVVKNGRELLHQWQRWLPRLKELGDRADCARAAVADLGGVAARHVALILDALPNPVPNRHVKDTARGLHV
jgi:3-deoxy-D-manno-octulosonic-acid transferase